MLINKSGTDQWSAGCGLFARGAFLVVNFFQCAREGFLMKKLAVWFLDGGGDILLPILVIFHFLGGSVLVCFAVPDSVALTSVWLISGLSLLLVWVYLSLISKRKL